MDLNEFALSYPDLYRMLNNNVRNVIRDHNITGDLPLRDWDDMIDSVLMLGGGNDFYDDFSDMDTLPVQQLSPFFSGRDEFDMRRRRRDFDLRDIIRLLFLRELFDRNRRRRR